MSVHEFELRSLDRELAAYDAEPGRLRSLGAIFERTSRLDGSWSPHLFLGDGTATSRARDEFARAAARADGAPLGRVTFGAVHLLGPRGLVVDAERRIVWIGASIGWPRPTAEAAVLEFGGLLGERDLVLLDDALFALPRSASHTRLHLLAQPGFWTFGHWLIDVIPRLVAITGQEATPTFYAPRVPPWARPFMRARRTDLEQVIATRGTVVRIEQLEVPTMVKRAKVLDPISASAAWRDLGARLGTAPASPDVDRFGPKLYVSRGGWATGRSLANHAQVEDSARSWGYTVIRPQELTLSDQRHIFSQATHVVGEDGSALHNILHAGAGARLAVIDLDRTNIFHASVARAVDQQVAHLQAEQTTDGWRLDPAALRNQLDELGF